MISKKHVELGDAIAHTAIHRVDKSGGKRSHIAIFSMWVRLTMELYQRGTTPADLAHDLKDIYAKHTRH